MQLDDHVELMNSSPCNKSPLTKVLTIIDEEGKSETHEVKQVPTLLFSEDEIAKSLQAQDTNWDRIKYQSYIFIIGLLQLTLSVLTYHDYTSYIVGYTYITNNWRQDYYTDIQIGYSDLLCSQELDESYIEMNTYEWPGSQNGCDCSRPDPIKPKKNSTIVQQSNDEIMEVVETVPVEDKNKTESNFTANLHVGETCSVQNQRQRCKSIDEQIPKPLHLWSDGQYGQPIRLCGQTQQNVNFANSAPQNDTCEPGQIACGSGDLLFCIHQNQSCPINYVGFKTKANFGNGVWTTQPTQDVLDRYNKIKKLIDSGHNSQAYQLGGLNEFSEEFQFFYFKNWTGYTPLSQIRVSETFKQGGGVCYQSELSNIDPLTSDYPLMNVERQNCIIDTNFQIFHIINEYQYYLCNNFLFIEQVLPNYEINPNKNWGIYFTGYIEWKAHCRGYLFDQTLFQGDLLPHIQNAQYGLIVVSSINFFVCSRMWYGMVLRQLYRNIFNQDKNKKTNGYIFFSEVMTKIISHVSFVSTVSYAFILTNNLKLFLEQVVHQNCSDPQTQQFFGDLLNMVNSQFWKKDLVMLTVFLITFVIDLIIYVVVQRRKKQLKEEKMADQSQSIGSPTNNIKYEQVLSSQRYSLESDRNLQLTEKQGDKEINLEVAFNRNNFLVSFNHNVILNSPEGEDLHQQVVSNNFKQKKTTNSISMQQQN